jgi:hypothetical protein
MIPLAGLRFGSFASKTFAATDSQPRPRINFADNGFYAKSLSYRDAWLGRFKHQNTSKEELVCSRDAFSRGAVRSHCTAAYWL